MHGEDLLVNDGSNWQAIEAISERLPELDVIPPFAFIIEAIDTVNRSAFVVTAEDEEIFGVLDLVREQEADRFERLLATVDIVSQEQVVGLRRETTILEEAQKIVVLPVNIAANLDTAN